MNNITVTPEELAAAFNHWKKRDEENPIAKSPPGDWGKNCADWLIYLVEEIQAGRLGIRV